MTCLMVGAIAVMLSGPGFSLHWTHSVEKVEWAEDWAVEGTTLRLTRARVKGSGAGMEPGEGAVLQGGWWVWSPDLSVRSLLLAASGATGAPRAGMGRRGNIGWSGRGVAAAGRRGARRNRDGQWHKTGRQGRPDRP
jgi:hypothetical protein